MSMYLYVFMSINNRLETEAKLEHFWHCFPLTYKNKWEFTK